MFARTVVIGMLVLASACAAGKPGTTRISQESPLITITAGVIDYGGARDEVWYAIDPQTQTCWFKTLDTTSPLDCCALHRVSEAQKFITWGNCPLDYATNPPAP
jgi:hypothetical protein